MKLNVTDVGFITEEPLSLTDYGSELDKLLGLYLYTDYFIIFQISGFLLLLATLVSNLFWSVSVVTIPLIVEAISPKIPFKLPPPPGNLSPIGSCFAFDIFFSIDGYNDKKYWIYKLKEK